MHILYVLAAANLYAQMHGLPGSQDQPALREMLKVLPLPGPQDLAPVFPSDLASAKLGEVLGPASPMLPPKGLTLSSACAIKGRGRLWTLRGTHYLSGPLTLLLSHPLAPQCVLFLLSTPSPAPIPLTDFQQKSTNHWALGSS